MSTAITKPLGAMERVLIGGDLSKLNEQERLDYYKLTCESLGLNPLTKPFDYIELNGKLVLYAKRDCTDQLRKVHGISVKILSREVVEGVYAVTSQARTPDGREDESIGAVPIVKEGGEWKSANGKRFFESNGDYIPLRPEDRANAIMKAETKSKRRVTLSICGLGMLDESELESIAEVRNRQQNNQDEVRDRKLSQIEAPMQVPPELEAMFTPNAPKGSTKSALETCRRELIEAMPQNGEDEYHRILAHNGITRESIQGGAAKVRNIATACTQMWTLSQSAKRLKPKEPELGVSEDDLPFGK